jgi:hypothetical protein
MCFLALNFHMKLSRILTGDKQVQLKRRRGKVAVDYKSD